MQVTDRRGLLGDRRTEERRTRTLWPAEADERRLWRDRRLGERRRMLPPRSRLVPALLVVAVTVADLAVAQVTEANGWPLLFIAAAFPLVAYDLANPWRWRWHLAGVWVAVSIFVLAAGVNIGYMVAS